MSGLSNKLTDYCISCGAKSVLHRTCRPTITQPDALQSAEARPLQPGWWAEARSLSDKSWASLWVKLRTVPGLSSSPKQSNSSRTVSIEAHVQESELVVPIVSGLADTVGSSPKR
jgi:hypothetical protein